MKTKNYFKMLLVSFLVLATTALWAGNVTITVTKSDATAFSGVSIHYFDGYWKSFGTTDGSGVATKTLPDGSYNIRASVGGTSDQQTIVVLGTTSGAFQTSKATVYVTKSDGSDFQGVSGYYYRGYWQGIGSTGADGKVSVEIFDGTYNFKAYVGGTTKQNSNVVISGNTTTSFQTSKATVHVTKSDGSNFQGVSAYYYRGYWQGIGSTGTDGKVSVEIFDGTRNFKASVGGTTKQNSNVVISGNTTVSFQTSLATFNAKASDGSALSGVAMFYYRGYWQGIGNTNGSGIVTRELFPGTYNTKANKGGTSVTQNFVLNSPGASVTYYTTEVILEAKDCDNGNPISGIAMYYHRGYWQGVGATNASGQKTIQLFSGTRKFKATTDGTTSATQTQVVAGDGATSGHSTTVTFSPTRVDLSFSGTVQYHAGYWRYLSSPDYLFAGTYNFKFGGNVQSLTISGCALTGNVHIFNTKKADGSALPNIVIYRNDYGNHNLAIGTTDAAGSLFLLDQPNGTWKFGAYKNHTWQFITSAPAVITFQTARFIVHAKKSDCTTDFAGIAASFNDYGNHYLSMGNTDANGEADIELFPGNRKFRAYKDHTAKTGMLDLPTSGTSGEVVLETSKYVVHVKQSDGADFAGIAASFNDYGNHYLSMGNTDANGKADIELFPGNRKFRAYKDHTANTGFLDIQTSCTSDIIVLQTALVTSKAIDCDNNNPIAGIKMYFNDYGNHYLLMGTTGASGEATIELFSGTNYKFRAYTIKTNAFQTHDLTAAGLTIEFNPTRVCFNYTGTVRFNDYGNHWLTIPCNTYMFPGTYDFKFYTGNTVDFSKTIAISGCSMEKSFATIRLIDNLGAGLAGGVVEYIKAGWQTAGTTDVNGNVFAMIDGTAGIIAFKMHWEGAYTIKNQNISTNSTVVFQTELVTFNLYESDGITALVGTTEYYTNANGWNTFGSGNTPTTMELLPVNYTFRVGYGGATKQKGQTISSSVPDVVFNTALVTVTLNKEVSPNDPLSGGVVQYYYYISGWNSFGTTDNNGEAQLELLPLTYTFQMAYTGMTKNKSGTIAFPATTVPFTWNGTTLKQNSFTPDYITMLNKVYPNPFNTLTTIEFSIEKEQKVIVVIYDMSGKAVKTLVDQNLSAGDHKFTWRSKNENGGEVKQGVYIVKLITGNSVSQKTIVKLR